MVKTSCSLLTRVMSCGSLTFILGSAKYDAIVCFTCGQLTSSHFGRPCCVRDQKETDRRSMSSHRASVTTTRKVKQEAACFVGKKVLEATTLLDRRLVMMPRFTCFGCSAKPRATPCPCPLLPLIAPYQVVLPWIVTVLSFASSCHCPRSSKIINIERSSVPR